MIRVALDAMGGDLGPRVVFECAIDRLSSRSDIEILFFYHESSLNVNDLISKIPSPDKKRLTFVKCADNYEINESVTRSLFRRNETSLYKALASVKDDLADVVVTFGNTGIMVALARHILGLIRSKLYPALIRDLSLQPLRCLTDLGANVHCPPEMLLGFAELAAAYVEELGDEKAKVGLLNVGIEASKGSNVIKRADNLLALRCWPEYVGYAEGYELFQGDKNVIVCDGMVGNAVLKASEGLLIFLMNKMKESGKSNDLMSFYQTEQRHGACLVGVCGNLVKGHGSSDGIAMAGAIEYGIKIAQTQLSKKIRERLIQSEE